MFGSFLISPAAKPVAEVKIAKAENPSTDAPKEVASEEIASEELAISEHNTTADAPAPAAVEEQSVDKTEEEIDFDVLKLWHSATTHPW